jgi:predicted dehydrogenase
MRGYPQEMEDFIGVIDGSQEPLSGPQLAFDIVDVVYAGYVSSDEGRRVALPESQA